MHNVSFIGLGPVGLCTAVCFATKGYMVMASEIDKTKANQIKGGKPPFFAYTCQNFLNLKSNAKTQNNNSSRTV